MTTGTAVPVSEWIERTQEPTPALHASDWIDRARGLAGAVQKWRDAAEEERHLPGPLCDALRRAHVFEMSTPHAVGGAEVHEATALRVIEELARHDGSVGWNAMIASITAITSARLPQAGLRQVYRSGPGAVVAGSLLPQGAAKPVAGGYSLSGRWKLGSGCHHADWMVACSIVMVHGAPRFHADGRPEIRAFFVPAAHSEILDTWHTMGLRGTGSHDYQITEAFVPEELSFPIFVDGPSGPGTLLLKDFAAYAAARVAAVALGIARDAVESFVALAKVKTPTVATGTLSTQHTTHERVGRAEALLRAGRALLFETVLALPYTPAWSVELDDELRAAIRLAGAHAAQNAAEAVTLMFGGAGTAGIYANSRLERCVRDIHVAIQHMHVASSNVEMVGQYLLGLGLHIRR